MVCSQRLLNIVAGCLQRLLDIVASCEQRLTGPTFWQYTAGVGKNVNSTTVSVRVPHQIAAALRRRAQGQGLSLNSWLLTLLAKEAKLADERREVRP